MKRFALVVLTVTLAASAPAAQDLERLFKAAVNTETVDRNCKGAIEQYKKVAAGSNRALAAQALLRMAGCYQSLRDAEAQRIYQRIIDDFADQKDALAISRARLNPTTQNSGAGLKGDRPVWTGPDVDVFGTVSPDGRYLTYVDWLGAQNVMLRDLVTNMSRPLTTNRKPGDVGNPTWSVISRDGTQAVFAWTPTASKIAELRVAALRTSGGPNSRVIAAFQERYPVPSDWSPDQKFIATTTENADKSLSLGIVSVQDGTFRQLKSLGWGRAGKLVFSPDGQFMAYDFATADHPNRRDIMVITTDANRDIVEIPVVADGQRNYVMGWSSAGDILFSSDRSGTPSLWTVRANATRTVGQPRLVKENVRGVSLGLTPSGTLYIWRPASATFVQAAQFDATQGRLLGSAGDWFQQFIDSRGWPRWSADGRYLIFVSCGLGGAGPCPLFIRDTGTGLVREIPHTLGYIQYPSVAPDGHAIVAAGEDLKGRSGIYLIDALTGATSMLAAGMLQNRYPEWSSDGRTIYYRHTRGDEQVLVARNVASGESKDIYRAADKDMSWMRVSPDGKMVGFIRHANPATFFVAPLSGGPERALFTSADLNGQMWQWSLDSQSMILQKHVTKGVELWEVPLAGSPRQLMVDGRQWSSFHLSADRKQIAFTAQAGEPGDQVWALENFLPKAGK